jgi:L-lactate dehydrogenase (cytochrome)/(S)-mandelate dehydrogenase
MVQSALNIWDLRDRAKRRLPRAIFEFVDRGTEDETLLRHNREMLERIRLSPRTLRDVSQRDQSIRLFGRHQRSPIIIGPTGIADMVWHRGELALAAAAANAGIPFTLATSSTTSIADIAKVATSGFWQQMYLWEKRELSWQVVERAAQSGVEALIVTVDTPILPNREFNKRNGMSNPIKPSVRLALDFMTHPRWTLSVPTRYLLGGGMPRFVNYPSAVGGSVSGPISRLANSASVTWKDVKELRKRWPNKLLLKGILNREDALASLDQGVDGIIVSNHGGRNFDASPAAIEVLGEIVDAVGARTTVLFDSGVRRGTDVLKALAIGANAVLIGRPTLYGLALAGQAGAARALSILTEEIAMAMAMLGVTSIGEIDRSYLREETVPGFTEAASPQRIRARMSS